MTLLDLTLAITSNTDLSTELSALNITWADVETMNHDQLYSLLDYINTRKSF